jgi:hypothetical protein
MSVKTLRACVPILGLIALVALFLKLPEISRIMLQPYCTLCAENTLYIVLIGAGYFSLLIALSLVFPEFPGPYLARGGLIGALLLGLTLAYLKMPNFCLLCAIGHACNIAIWSIWCFRWKGQNSLLLHDGFRLYLVFLAPLSIIALFNSLNLTAFSYQPKELAVIPEQPASTIAQKLPETMKDLP